jgi:heat shock protein HslJ
MRARTTIALTGCWTIEEWRERIIGHVWAAKEIAGASAIEGSRITLVLQTDGTASGWSGCNNYRVPYTLEAETLHFGAIMAANLPCTATLAEQERRYFDALGSVERADLAKELGFFSERDLVLYRKSGPPIRFRQD